MKPKRTKTNEYFSEKEYGVKASPRVSAQRSKLPRGGGRDQIGKPYKIKGKWYKPTEDPDYRKVGAASWYGDAFHGRLTANGEIYDMTHLTAAHPTMPLPSYARVTNTKNGNSVIVRVNDRGPFANNRIIDLSKRAAEMLDYKHSGVAKVEVAYLGRAPLHGRDDDFLLASYRPGGAAPDPSDGLPAGVMVAMNGPTPSTRSRDFPVALASAAPGQRFPIAPAPPAFSGAMANSSVGPGDPLLPDVGPIVPERPSWGQMVRRDTDGGPSLLAYADRRVSRAAEVLEAFASGGMTAGDVAASWQRTHAGGGGVEPAGDYVSAGTFSTRAEALAMAATLSGIGDPVVAADGDVFTLDLHPDGRASLDDILRAAWQAGAADAMTVRTRG